jgi:hypothetical protein
MIKEIDVHCIENDKYGFTIPYLFFIEKNKNHKKSIKSILYSLSNQKKAPFNKLLYRFRRICYWITQKRIPAH